MASNDIPVEWEHTYDHDQMLADHQTLRKAGVHLAAWGWWVGGWLILWTFLIFFAIMLGRIGPAQLVVLAFIMMVWLALTLGIFSVSRFIQEGHRWAICVALLIVSAMVFVTMHNMFVMSRGHLWTVVVDTMFMILHLNSLKLLIQSWGASRRLARVTVEAVPDEPLLEEAILVDKA
jgi:hypothetical protein